MKGRIFMLENKENMCAFYASDYHFEMMILPYLDKKIEENNNIVIFTENNLKDTINVLVSKTNLKEEKKEKILNLDWKNNDLKKFENLKEYEKSPKETCVFIKGTENYIKNVRNNINTNSKENKLNIIDCYFVDDIDGNINKVAKNYKNILNTKGEAKIN
jgi:hypothetical protein